MDEKADISGKRILFVEDEEVTREYAATVLHDCGCTVLTAADGQSALQLYEAQGGRLDLVSTDWRMPKMDGRQLIIELRERGFKGAFLLTSAHINEKNTQHFHTAFHIDHLLPKPFSVAELREMVARVLK